MAGKTRRDRGGGARIRRARRGAGGGPDPCTEWGIRWAPIEEFLSDEAPVTVSGGLCEHCMEEHRDADLGKR